MPIRFFRKLLSGQRQDSPRGGVPSRAALPAGLRVYAIGDIHGRLDRLLELEERVRDDLTARPTTQAMAIYLGDYVDRGVNSRGVLDYLLTADRDGLERRFLRGNHEETMLEYLDNPDLIRSWKKYGGLETLFSYGVDVRPLMRGEGSEKAHADFRAAFPAEHQAFLEGLAPILTIGDYCFVHAGVRPGVPIERQVPADLLWIREEFLGHQGDFGKVVVHGHTPVDEPMWLPNRVNVDTGAYLT